MECPQGCGVLIVRVGGGVIPPVYPGALQLQRKSGIPNSTKKI